MTELTIADRLLGSCEKLLRQGILTQNQYKTCVQSIAGSDTNRQIKITEDKVFSSSRANKEGKYNEFIESINKVIKETIDNHKKATSDDEKKKYEEILIQITILMNNIIDWIQKVSLERYKVKETSDYEQLVFYYNKIDNNRKEIDKINEQMMTLKQRYLTQDEKLLISENEYKSSRNVTISLIVFNIITFVIIFLIYFI